MRLLAACAVLVCFAWGCAQAHAGPDATEAPDASAATDTGDGGPPPRCPYYSIVWSRREVYVEPTSGACAPERPACVVYRLDGNPHADCEENCADPAEAMRRVFCTCRCDGPDACACREGETCEELARTVGSFCVPDAVREP